MQALVNTLENCGYEVHCVSNKSEAFELSKTYIKSGMSVGLGGSVSVGQIGLLDYLVNKKDINFKTNMKLVFLWKKIFKEEDKV
jgi:hypothetical protein